MSQLFKAVTERLLYANGTQANTPADFNDSPESAHSLFRSFLHEQQDRLSRESTPVPPSFDHYADTGSEIVPLRSPATAASGTLQLARHQKHLQSPSAQRPSQQALRMSDLICQYCRKLMTTDREPMLLQCGHSFCKQCVHLMPVFGGKRDDTMAQEAETLRTLQPALASAASSSSLTGMLVGFFGREPRHPADEPDTPAASVSGKPPVRPASTLNHHRNDRGEGEIQEGHVLCLECRGRTTLDVGGLGSLEVNTFLATAADRLAEKMSICADCERSMTSKYCEDCTMYLCNPCSKRIHSGASTGKHHVIDLENMRPEESTARSSICPSHPKSEAALYCKTCHALACVLCAYGAHKQHDICLLSESAETLKKSLQATTSIVAQRNEGIQRAISAIDDELQLLKENKEQAKVFVKSKMEDIRNQLDFMEAKMLNDMETNAKSRDTMLRNQLHNLHAVTKDLKLRNSLSKTILMNQNAAEAVQLANRQIQVLKAAVEELPSVAKCISAKMEVTFTDLAARLHSMAEVALQEKFPVPVEERTGAFDLPLDVDEMEAITQAPLTPHVSEIQEEREERQPTPLLTQETRPLVEPIFSSPRGRRKERSIREEEPTKPVAKRVKKNVRQTTTTSSQGSLAHVESEMDSNGGTDQEESATDHYSSSRRRTQQTTSKLSRSSKSTDSLASAKENSTALASSSQQQRNNLRAKKKVVKNYKEMESDQAVSEVEVEVEKVPVVPKAAVNTSSTLRSRPVAAKTAVSTTRLAPVVMDLSDGDDVNEEKVPNARPSVSVQKAMDMYGGDKNEEEDEEDDDEDDDLEFPTVHAVWSQKASAATPSKRVTGQDGRFINFAALDRGAI